MYIEKTVHLNKQKCNFDVFFSIGVILMFVSIQEQTFVDKFDYTEMGVWVFQPFSINQKTFFI